MAAAGFSTSYATSVWTLYQKRQSSKRNDITR